MRRPLAPILSWLLAVSTVAAIFVLGFSLSAPVLMLFGRDAPEHRNWPVIVSGELNPSRATRPRLITPENAVARTLRPGSGQGKDSPRLGQDLERQ